MTRWGIAGTGGIASKMALALQRVEYAQLAAVASRDPAGAAPFGAQVGAPVLPYEQLLSDPTIDIIYIASPHSEHCRPTLPALHAAKHVLVANPTSLTLTPTPAMLHAPATTRPFVWHTTGTHCLAR